jgi:hypothetical protein
MIKRLFIGEVYELTFPTIRELDYVLIVPSNPEVYEKKRVRGS